jgi:hypothetical protein
VVEDLADNRSVAVVNCYERLVRDIARLLLDGIPGDALEWVFVEGIERHAIAAPRGSDHRGDRARRRPRRPAPQGLCGAEGDPACPR